MQIWIIGTQSWQESQYASLPLFKGEHAEDQNSSDGQASHGGRLWGLKPHPGIRHRLCLLLNQ